jgi:hypothetical protein
VQRGVADDAARWECFVNLLHHQRGSDQPSSSIQFNIVFDDGQQVLNHDSRRSPDLRLTVIGGRRCPRARCCVASVVPVSPSSRYL